MLSIGQKLGQRGGKDGGNTEGPLMVIDIPMFTVWAMYQFPGEQ